MPVSKKRKKDGKKVQRQAAPLEPRPEDHPQPARSGTMHERMGQPKNPFVSMQQQHRGAQRGR
jgi:hypothetical protein